MKAANTQANLFYRLVFVIAILSVFSKIADCQSFYLKDYVMGHSYEAENSGFEFLAGKSCPYNWSVETNRVDYSGGEILLRVAPGTNPSCRSTYKITWTFSKDMRTVTCGEKIFVDITNIPISRSECNEFLWGGVNNPSGITIVAGSDIGESSRLFDIRGTDPGSTYRDYVFQHDPRHIVQGEPFITPKENVHLNQARLEIIACSRPDFAKSADGGSFALRIGNQGISYDVIYLYSKKEAVPRPALVSIAQPIIQHNVENAEGTFRMKFRIPGYLRDHQGKEVQVLIRFVNSDGNFIPGNLSDPKYVDALGHAATSSGRISIPSNNFDLSSINLWMPYYALNLAFLEGEQTCDLNAFAEVVYNNRVVAQSHLVPIQIMSTGSVVHHSSINRLKVD